MTVQILTGDCRELLRALPAESVHCVVTSPPYFGLRDYEVAGQVGQEATLAGYIGALVASFAEIRRVLRRDGSVWLNLGDSYAGNWGASAQRTTPSHDPSWSGGGIRSRPKKPRGMAAVRDLGIKPKERMLVPARVALALQADGWWVRDDIVWAKPNPLPESVTDRCTASHEAVFHLTRQQRYYFDRFAVLEQPADSTVARLKQDVAAQRGSDRAHAGGKANGPMNAVGSLAGANRRNVWTIAAEPSREPHFATMPSALAELCILAGTSAGGACPHCLAPLRRVVADRGPDRAAQQRSGGDAEGTYRGQSTKDHAAAGVQDASAVKRRILKGMRQRDTVGWEPSCTHKAALHPVPCTVLDPFAGIGTTGLVADRLQRNAVLIELSPKYAAIARRRITADAPPMFPPVAAEPGGAQAHLFPAAKEAAA